MIQKLRVEGLSSLPGAETVARRLLDELSSVSQSTASTMVIRYRPGGRQTPRVHRRWRETESLQPWSASRYEVEYEIDEGSMGTIFCVWDRDLQRQVAMKRIRRRGSSNTQRQMVSRIRDEARIMGQLEHPGILPVYDIGRDGSGDIYFTMRLVRGQDLREIFEVVRGGEVGWTQGRAADVILEACEIIAYAHSRGVIHRDLKPSNIMVGRRGDVFLVDWGLAKVLGPTGAERLPGDHLATTDTRGPIAIGHPLGSPSSVEDGITLGTPAYMPPEQALGHQDQVGPWSDLYSLGAIFYELLTGRVPYHPRVGSLTGKEVLEALTQGPPAPVREINPHCPEEQIAVCEKAMARDPRDRYSDADELARDLRRSLRTGSPRRAG